jgi:CBS domain-containing protein
MQARDVPDMQAQDVMVCGVISVGPDIPVRIAANAMVVNCVSALPVINIYAKLVGIVSEGDLIRRVEIGTERRRSGGETLMSSDSPAKDFVKSHAKRVSDVMTREVITAQPETPLREIADLMQKHSIKRVPIVRDELVVGIVSRANLLQVLPAPTTIRIGLKATACCINASLTASRISHGRADPSTSSSITAAPISGDLSTAWMRRPPFALRPKQRQESSRYRII